MILTNDELELLTVILDEYDYSEQNVDLFHKLQYKVYKQHNQSYQDKLTTIGGQLVWQFIHNQQILMPLIVN